MRHRLLLALSLCACTAADAETAYVTDSLRLGIHAASDTNDRPFDSLISGTPMEVLDRTTNYARVRLTDGREGWVKAMYLETEKPPAARILELEGEVASMTGAVAAAKAAQARAEQELGKLTSQLQATTGSSEAVQDTLARLKSENEAYGDRLDAYRYSLPLRWIAVAVLIALTAGFLSGVWWLDALIRRRHGGFRVY
jgi:SH3 domain protein